MKKSTQFIILTCIVSWIIAGVAIWLGLREAKGAAYVVFGAAYMLLPAVCAIILQVIHNEKPFSNLYISFKFNKWFIIAGLLPIVYAFMAFGINLLFPNVSFSATAEGMLSMLSAEEAAITAAQISKYPPAVFMLISVVPALIAGYTINTFFAFGEELGWRGYLLREFRDKKFLSVSLITGIVWGLWHFPLILIGHNYPDYPVAGVGMMVIFCVLVSPVMTYIVIKSKSVITAAIFHGTMNAIAGITIMFVAGGNGIINGATGIAGFVALMLINFAFYLYDKYVTKENIFTKEIASIE
jgi:membrane protease YdiL (CAAX protease family)